MAGGSSKTGTLFVVATPIGNLEDITLRAIRILGEVDLVAAEDTRHSAKLLRHHGVRPKLVALHEHNEQQVAPRLLRALEAGRDVALISDAGTPLVSDPGYHLVRAARRRGIAVAAVPGPSAAVAALSVAGLPSDRFAFEGFLPARARARRRRLEALRPESRTLVFYEAAHRIAACLDDMAEILGAGREAVLARELTKRFESVRSDTLGGLSTWIRGSPERRKGEFVLVVRGAEAEQRGEEAMIDRVLGALLEVLPLKEAAAAAAKITGAGRRDLYKRGLAHKRGTRAGG